MRISNYFFHFFFLCSFSIFSEAIEKWSPEKARAGEIVNYEIEILNAKEDSIQHPNLGFYPETELPRMEILSLNKTETKFQFQVRFLEAGKFIFPIEWKDADDQPKKANKVIQIESNLTGSEFDIYDITEPIEFSGPFLIRLLVWFLGIVLVLGLFFYLVSKIKLPSRTVKDAKFQILPTEKENKVLENQLLKLLELEEIPHKEFVYLLSFEIKNFLHDKYGIDSESLTNRELMEFIQSKTHLNDLEKMKMENYLDMIKYMPNEEKISREVAKKIYKNWLDILKK